MDIKGLDKLLKDLNRIEDYFPKEVKRTTNTIGVKLVGDIKEVTPVDTGNLREKISFKNTGVYEVTAGTSLKYAPAVNYGHRTRLGIKDKKKRKKRKKKAGDKPTRKRKVKTTGKSSYVQGFYFLERGISNFQKYNLIPTLNDIFEKVLK